jgi:hypothetical protein
MNAIISFVSLFVLTIIFLTIVIPHLCGYRPATVNGKYKHLVRIIGPRNFVERPYCIGCSISERTAVGHGQRITRRLLYIQVLPWIRMTYEKEV